MTKDDILHYIDKDNKDNKDNKDKEFLSLILKDPKCLNRKFEIQYEKLSLISILLYNNKRDLLLKIKELYPSIYLESVKKIKIELKERPIEEITYYIQNNKDESLISFINTLELLKDKELIELIIKNPRFISNIDTNKNNLIIEKIEKHIPLSDFIDISFKEQQMFKSTYKSIYLSSLKNYYNIGNDLDLIKKISNVLLKEENNDILLDKFKIFFNAILKKNLSEEVLKFICELNNKIPYDLNDIDNNFYKNKLIYTIISNHNISTESFLKVFKNDIERLKKDKDDYLLLLDSLIFFNKNELFLNLIKEEKNILLRETKNKFSLYEIVFSNKTNIKEEFLYDNMDLIFFNNTPPEKEKVFKLKIFEDILNLKKMIDIKQLVLNNIHVILNDINVFKLFYKNIDVFDENERKKFLIETFKYSTNFSIINYLKEENKENKLHFYLIFNENFLKYIEENPNQEENYRYINIFLRNIDINTHKLRSTEKLLKDINYFSDYLQTTCIIKNINSDENILNSLLVSLKKIKDSKEYSMNFSSINIDGENIFIKEAYDIIENKIYNKITEINCNDSIFIEDKNNFLNNFYSIISEKYLKDYILKNINNLNKEVLDKTFLAISNSYKNNTIEFIEINKLILKKLLYSKNKIEENNINKRRL